MKEILFLALIGQVLYVQGSSYRAHYAKHLMLPKHVDYLREPLKPAKHVKQSSQGIKVGIIGAGLSGLYSALILDSLNIDFEILEANKEHIGGRAFTYYFNKNYKNAKTCRDFYDYAEMGAMRLPKVDTRLVGDVKWSLINYLNNHKAVVHKPKLIKFLYSNDNTMYYFNGKKIYYSDSQDNDPLYFGDSNNGGLNTGVPDSYANKPYYEWIDRAVQPFVELMKINMSLSYEFLKKYDNNSVRSFMVNYDAVELRTSMGLMNNYVSPVDLLTQNRIDRNYPQMVIDWLESLDSGSTCYDRSLAETVIDSYEFTSENWVTIDGGVGKLAEAMVEAVSLNSCRIRKGKHVTKISKVNNSTQIKVTAKDGSSYKYDHVISTMPLGPLQSVDTRGLDLSLKKRMAMRMLSIDASVKIALKFKTRWWQDPVKMKNKPIKGGQTFTDLPIRKIVYPSYGVDCENATGTILVSYTWAQDATRLGSRVQPKIPSQATKMKEDELIQDVLDQLTLIHGSFIRKEYMNKYYVMNWNDNYLAMGAFGFFAPGQYSTLYPSMIRAEANGYMHFGGEALSVHHGWIIGALNSGYRTVMEILMKENMTDKLGQLKEIWGEVDELEFFS